LVSTKASSLCNFAVGSQNLHSLTTSGYNTAIGQNSSTNITTGSNNVTIGYDAGGGGNGIVTGGNNIAIGYSATNSTNDATVSNNIYIGPNTATSAIGVSNSMMLGTGATSGISNKFMINNIHHLNIPALTTQLMELAYCCNMVGQMLIGLRPLGGLIIQWKKIDTIISTMQGHLPAKIIRSPGYSCYCYKHTWGLPRWRQRWQWADMQCHYSSGRRHGAQYKAWGSDTSWHYYCLWYLSGDKWHPCYHM